MKTHQLLLCCILLLLSFVLPSAALAAGKNKKEETKPGTIVFLPFAVITQPPQDHLRSGLTSILATRVSGRTGLAAVHGSGKTDALEELLKKGGRQEVKKILKAMQGDYLVAGSLEQQKEGYEIIIHVFSGGRAAPAVFNRTAAALDKAIPALDELSGEIADKIFSQKQPEEGEPDNRGISGFQTAHPDKAWRDALVSAAAPGTAGAAFQALQIQRSGELAASLRGMDVGDLDGDGQEEIVLIEQGRLALCRFGGGFRQIAELPLPGYLGLHTVHIADLDGSKGLEIYISASSGSSPASRVLRWDGSSFQVLDEHVPFYLRPDRDAAGRPVLLGQAADGGIFRLTVSPSGNVMPAEQMEVPKGFGLYDFIRADLDGDGRREFVGLTEENHLVILEQSGKPLWKSEEGYGAGRDALGTLISRRQAELDRRDAGGRGWLHTRIIAQDVTGDGKPEIIVGRNRVTNVKYFNNLRWFEGSSLAALRWDGSRMHTLWETNQVPGYTVDYQLLRSAEQPDRLRLFTAESNDSGNPLYFWTREKIVVTMQELSAAGGTQ